MQVLDTPYISLKKEDASMTINKEAIIMKKKTGSPH